MQTSAAVLFLVLAIEQYSDGSKTPPCSKSGHLRRLGVLLDQFWGKLVVELSVGVALNIHQYLLLYDMCGWVRLNVQHLPNQRVQFC